MGTGEMGKKGEEMGEIGWKGRKGETFEGKRKMGRQPIKTKASISSDNGETGSEGRVRGRGGGE